MSLRDLPPLTTLAAALLVLRGAFALWQDVKRAAGTLDNEMDLRAGRVGRDVRKRIA